MIRVHVAGLAHAPLTVACDIIAENNYSLCIGVNFNFLHSNNYVT